jgi:hypothetical protein
MQLRGDGQFQVLERINDNAYKVSLQGEYDVSVIFNISNMFLFDVDENSRSNPFKKRKDDENR